MDTSRRDAVATVLVAAAVAAYLGYLVVGSLPFVEDARGMAAVGLVLGFASRRIGGRGAFPHPRVALLVGLGTTALGIVALASGNSIVLAAFMASTVALWAAATVLRTGGVHPQRLRATH